MQLQCMAATASVAAAATRRAAFVSRSLYSATATATAAHFQERPWRVSQPTQRTQTASCFAQYTRGFKSSSSSTPSSPSSVLTTLSKLSKNTTDSILLQASRLKEGKRSLLSILSSNNTSVASKTTLSSSSAATSANFSTSPVQKGPGAAIPLDAAATADAGDQSRAEDASTSAADGTKPIVGYWYLFSSALVFGIVVLGGVTRLTESGLSIVEWNVIKGMKPPRSEEEWVEEFEKYKQFPEFKLLNNKMTLEEFKFIFYMEWAHRMVGRFIGLSFVIPGAYFAYKGWMSPAMRSRSLLVGAAIGVQGLLGWLMVSSGLKDEIIEKNAHPRVNHFWLSAHMGAAFILYSMMTMTGWEILNSGRTKMSEAALKFIRSAKMAPFRRSAAGLGLMIFITAMSGAWVAGLDAGLIYNEFPKMGEGYMPSDMWALSTKSENNPNPLPWYRDLMENPSAVQFNHRVLAMGTTAAISALWLYSMRLPLPRNVRFAAHGLMGMCMVQVTLGLTTLLYLVPVPLAAAHQGGSLALLTTALWLSHNMRRIPK
ncbi:Cytochrome c oxidase assembly protein cox15 [Quaeritorhiza haematococci]|nr:Cytochrome c oxidase assembly protein cox15 [Quaeritorhiza haematococci]